MSIYFVGAGPGDPELLTVKAQGLLSRADCCIWAGSLVNPQILQILPTHAEVHDSSAMTLAEIVETMMVADKNRQCVVRLHTGDPSIFSAIGEQMDALCAQGVPFEIVPGISAFQGAAAAMKVELTRPELTQTVVLTRTPGRTPMPETEAIEHFARTGATLCLYLSVGQIAKLAYRLRPFYGEMCPAAVIYRATWPDELVLRGNLSNIAWLATSSQITRTALVMVGWAIEGNRSPSRLYSSNFSHQFRKSESQ